MRRFLIAAVAVAAIANAPPLSAQPAPANPPPSGASAAHPQSSNRMPAGGAPTSERGLPGSVERAHHRAHRTHARTHTTRATRAQSQGTADQLNQQELAKIQGGNQASPGEQGANPTTMNRMPAGGRPTSGGPRQ